MPNSRKGLKIVATWEAIKGLIALIVGLGLHEHFGAAAQKIVVSLFTRLHLNPGSQLAKIIHDDGNIFSHADLTLILIGSVIYSILRLVEAYGLWKGLIWTEWFALLSGAIYLPFEIYEIGSQQSILSVVVFTSNVVVVGYLYLYLRRNRQQRGE